MNVDIFRHKELSSAELNNEAEFLAYALNNAGINFRDGGTITTHNIRDVFEYPAIFDYPASGCYQESPVIQRAYDKNLLIVVERPIDGYLSGGVHIGLRKRTVTANPFPNIPAKLLEYGNDYAQLRISPPQKRVAELRTIIQDVLKDTGPLEQKISLLKTNANVMYDEILSMNSANTVELMQSGGFTIVPMGIEAVQKEIEQIENARRIVGGYNRDELKSVSEALKNAKIADEFYIGKPPLKQDERIPREGEVGFIRDVYSKGYSLKPLTKDDVGKYRKLWERREL